MKQTNDDIFSKKAEENFNLAKIFLNVRVRTVGKNLDKECLISVFLSKGLILATIPLQGKAFYISDDCLLLLWWRLRRFCSRFNESGRSFIFADSFL